MAKFKAHKRIFLVIAIIINLVNFIANWMLYADIVNLKPGLVFGPYPAAFNYTVLGLCILSTLIHIVEITSLYTELFKKESCFWFGGQTTSAMSIWLDDIPKAGIMLYISACHDMAISVEEIVRAILLVVTIVIRGLAYVIRETCVRRRQKDSLPTREEIMYRRKSCRGCHFGFICIGLLFKLIAFIIIYMFTFFTVYPGGLTYKMPSGLFEPKRNVSRFVYNSSIFAGIPSAGNKWKWVEVSPLSSIIKGKECSTVLKLKKDSSTSITTCTGNQRLDPIISPSILSKFDTPSQYEFKFKYVIPTKSLLLGNIEYTATSNGVLIPDTVQMKYFCANKPPKDLFKELLVGGTDSDKTEVKVVVDGLHYVPVYHCWKTGKADCKMTGLDGPLLIRNM